jgi:hypothetical protein
LRGIVQVYVDTAWLSNGELSLIVARVLRPPVPH